ncbi:hypothetical protein A3A09_00270 [Candidatus Nomurabacteria bacterium RIFCSPLOWO2_01_FULL_42_20]|nr:MAG: hypothetical protein A3A09_00270 [Candidatus Nomurabacteria bacterium RIFCSPLOWO2_01_FULL_42_20]
MWVFAKLSRLSQIQVLAVIIKTNSMTQVRLMTESDSLELSQVIKEVIQDIPYYNDLAKSNEIKKFSASALADKIREDKYSAIVATENKKIIGFCLSRFDDYLIWLEWFGILKNQRGKRISKLLLEELEKTTHLRGCHKIWCDCRTTNEASKHILSAFGYQQIATVSNHWYGQDFILWQKLLAK